MKKASWGSIEVAQQQCKGCGLCLSACVPAVLVQHGKLNRLGYVPVGYKGSGCTACGVCFYVCPEPGAITVLLQMGGPQP